MITRAYYLAKPLLPRRVQLALRRLRVRRIRKASAGVWPIHPDSGTPPPGWRGWPHGKDFAFVLTHDVEHATGVEKCTALMGLECAHGFRSSFNIVPERYPIPHDLRSRFISAGFEVGVHGLVHDGRYFSSEAVFNERVPRINRYLREWDAAGFRSPSMMHNLEWLGRLDLEYDSSTFDTDPFEPQPDGVTTIFPFTVRGAFRTYVELPYTLPQDHTLFVIMRERTIDVWKRKLDWVAARGGMILVDTHPDYMHFGPGRIGGEEYSVHLYEELLDYVAENYSGRFWHALPRDVARFWRSLGEGSGVAVHGADIEVPAPKPLDGAPARVAAPAEAPAGG